MKPNGWGEEATPKVMADLRTMLGGGLTFKDNFNAALVTFDCKHNVETRVTNPLTTKPIEFIPISSVAITAVGGQSNGSARAIDGYPVLNTSRTDGYLGVTVKYAPSAEGEVVNATVARGSAVGLSNGTPANVTSITVSAGSWQIAGMIQFLGSPTGIYIAGSVGITSATLGTYGDSAANLPTMPNANSDSYLVVPGWPLTTTTSKTVYLVAQAGFSAATISAFGRITATRTAIDPSTLGRVSGWLVGG